MRAQLESLGFKFTSDFDSIVEEFAAAQEFRADHKTSESRQLTRTTALAVALSGERDIQAALERMGFSYSQFIDKIGLPPLIKSIKPTKDIEMFFSLEDAIKRYSMSQDSILITSKATFAIIVLEDAFKAIGFGELGNLLVECGLDIEKLSGALRSRTLPFDPRRFSTEADIGSDKPAITASTITPFYADQPAQSDLLNRKAVADTIVTLVKKNFEENSKYKIEDKSFIIHLHGRWGSGKTSILNFLSDALLSDGPPNGQNAPPWAIVNYNAWRNQSLGPAWWTLMETVYAQAREQLGGWKSKKGIAFAIRDRWWRIRSSHAPLALTTIALIAIALWISWILKSDLFAKDKSWFSEGLATIAASIGIVVAIFTFGQTYRIGSARTARSYLELSRDPISPLVRRYTELVADVGIPVAVFIDDLDRCNGEFVVEVLQTVQTMFRNARALYIVAADRDWVCSAYQQQYAKFNDCLGEPGKSLGHLFVEKVFQLSIEVPRLGESDRDIYWNRLINSQQIEEKVSSDVILKINEELERANTESEIENIIDRYHDNPLRASIAAAQAFKRLHAAPLVKAREHFLQRYKDLIEPNPRAMKRLLNAYGFRRGFDLQSGRRSDPDALVRWTILENRWPILADYLEGRSSGIRQPEIIEALKKDPEVLKVAEGLTWEKLRPVPSAPDQPPTPYITPGAEA